MKVFVDGRLVMKLGFVKFVRAEGVVVIKLGNEPELYTNNINIYFDESEDDTLIVTKDDIPQGKFVIHRKSII